MLGFYRAFFLVLSLDIYVESAVPTLSVKKLNRRLVEKKRKDTLDLCLLFNEEHGKAMAHSKHRFKRALTSLDDEERVENIVDRLYDDQHDENGARVTYRQRIIKTTNAAKSASGSGRRFDFAPGFLEPGPDLVGPQGTTTDPDENQNEVTVDWHKKWKHGIIPFFIDPKTYDSYLAEKILKAFEHFEHSTCIRLQRLRTKPTDKKSMQRVEWLYITNPSGTRQCVHTNANKMNSGVQMVLFGYDCMSLGEIVHELLHILGFSHEHVRKDRDRYISVMWDNIKPGYKKFFEVQETDARLLALPYDYGSVLHYPPRAFSRNGKYTLMAEPGVKIGQRNGLSELDIEKVSKIFGNECMNRNKDYLLNTCNVVVSSADQKAANVSDSEINNYFKDKLWHHGVVNYKLRDKVEFTTEERENIRAVIKHIMKETCIEFNDLTVDENSQNTNDPVPHSKPLELEDKEGDIMEGDKVHTNNTNDAVLHSKPLDLEDKEGDIMELDKVQTNNTNDAVPHSKPLDLEHKEGDIMKGDKVHTSNKTKDNNEIQIKRNSTRVKDRDTGQRKANLKTKENTAKSGMRKSDEAKPSRRHAEPGVYVLTRSPEPACRCPEPGHPNAEKNLEIGADCFNSVNDLLHLFVHVLGLDHQHNMHDRDSYLAINWTQASEDVKKELKNKLPPAASVGFPYDYQSVMHYPWLEIKNGITNLMYPIWNDGWVMGHWQGLSSVDVQKINSIYHQQCTAREEEKKKNKTNDKQ